MSILVTFKDNWADEMNIFGFRMMKVEEWEEYREMIMSNKDEEGDEIFPRNCHVGSNQFIHYVSPEDYLSCFQLIILTESDVAFMYRAFPDGFGHSFPI